VVDVQLQKTRYPLCQAALLGALGPSPAEEPMPLVPSYLWSSKVCHRSAHTAANLMHSLLQTVARTSAGKTDQCTAVFWTVVVSQ
jgi:hypothetical protein